MLSSETKTLMFSKLKPQLAAMVSRRHASTMATRPHVLVVGGAYAGVSTVQNMLGILSGKGCLPSPFPTPEVKTLPSVLPIISVLDQRDGLCKLIRLMAEQ
jgi:hypothetical protein